MTPRRLVLGGTVAALAVTVLLLGGVLRESSSEARGLPRPARPVTPALVVGFSPTADTEALVRDLQARVRAAPRDGEALTLLGLAYQQGVRETGDFAYLAKSEGVLRRALRIDPKDARAVYGLGSLALARHEFRRALALGRRAQSLAPAARNLGVIGDALLQLGRYDEAFATFDRMARMRPDLAAYARISYGRELIGKPRAAIAAMKLARDAAGVRPESIAWTHVELGKLHLGLGELRPAERNFQAALAAFPGYVYALEQLAHVEAARGHHNRAAAFARRAVDRVPLPQFVSTLGDVYAAAGKPRLAQEQYALMGAIERLLKANGVRTDLETALFNADHGIRLGETLTLARRAQRERPSIEGDDVLAWTLARTGRCREAQRYSQRSLRLGTRDGLKLFHRAEIERCLGNGAGARTWARRALALNPHFSILWAPKARRLAA